MDPLPLFDPCQDDDRLAAMKQPAAFGIAQEAILLVKDIDRIGHGRRLFAPPAPHMRSDGPRMAHRLLVTDQIDEHSADVMAGHHIPIALCAPCVQPSHTFVAGPEGGKFRIIGKQQDNSGVIIGIQSISKAIGPFFAGCFIRDGPCEILALALRGVTDAIMAFSAS